MKKTSMKKSRFDYILAGTIGILVVLGILILAGVSAVFSQEKLGTTFYFLNHQILLGILPGLILGFLAFKISISLLKKWAPILVLINLGLMAIVFLPKIFSQSGQAARWINLGPISFQPSEFLKLTFLLYLAIWLSSKGRKIGYRRTRKISKTRRISIHRKKGSVWFSETLIAFLVISGTISLFLIFQPDISTLAVIISSAGLMYFLANTPLWHSFLMVLMGLGGLFALIKIAPYRMARWTIFLNPEIDPMGMGYQIKQALIAVGSGGILGLGLGMSRQKFGFLPQPMTDSVFAIFAEETGFIGSLILISLFLVFLWRGFKIAKDSSDKFSQLLALGITFWISIQAFVNIGAMIGILPLTGIPLPFISYGGSHLIVELVGAGILLNISKNISK